MIDVIYRIQAITNCDLPDYLKIEIIRSLSERIELEDGTEVFTKSGLSNMEDKIKKARCGACHRQAV